MKNSARLFLIALTVAALIVTACCLAVNFLKQSIIEENEIAVHGMAQSLLPTLVLGDVHQIESLFNTLARDLGTQSAELVSGTGMPIASYRREGVEADTTLSQFALASVRGGMNAYELRVVAPLTFDTQILANLHVTVNLWPAYLRLLQLLSSFLFVTSMLYMLVRSCHIKIRFERAGPSVICRGE